jgi:hypothetical protein
VGDLGDLGFFGAASPTALSPSKFALTRLVTGFSLLQIYTWVAFGNYFFQICQNRAMSQNNLPEDPPKPTPKENISNTISNTIKETADYWWRLTKLTVAIIVVPLLIYGLLRVLNILG